MLNVVITLFGTLFGLLAGGVWIGISLAVTGTLMLALFRNIPLDKLLPQYAWNILTTQELLALPLFIVMGELLFRTHLSRALFTGLAPWAGLLPGRLLHVNVLGCSVFAAISGSSAATTQVVGRMALAELMKRVRRNPRGKIDICVGEAKSRMEITDADVSNLRAVADAFPREDFNTYVVFSKLIPFTQVEIERIRPLNDRRPRAIMFTPRELEPYRLYERTAKEYRINQYAVSLEEMARVTAQVFFS